MTTNIKMGAALAQILRWARCEDAEWHSRCCSSEEGCLCDAEAHGGGAGPTRDVEVHGGTCCWLEAHEGAVEKSGAEET